MKCIYFDCFAGISGDMTLGAFLDLGVPRRVLAGELKKLGVAGYRITVARAMKMGISGCSVQVHMAKQHGHAHRSYKTIESLIQKSTLTTRVKDLSINIFHRIAQAEAHVHQTSIDDVHFHEIGALDSIVDIVGSAICLDYVGADTCYASPVPFSSGFVQSDHGTLPVPAPATLLLLKGIPVVASNVSGETVTPTGAAILAALVRYFGAIPPMTIQNIGYGAGTRDVPQMPNMLRIILGETSALPSDEHVWVLETNIDDMNPEWSGFLMERLLTAGALDVAVIPVHMKKNRPGIMLQVICDEKHKPILSQLIFRESTTAGVRSYCAERTMLMRSAGSIKTKFGTLHVKLFNTDTGTVVTPEFEECKKVALRNGVPLKEVYNEVIASSRKGGQKT
jgi:hypothetical protein